MLLRFNKLFYCASDTFLINLRKYSPRGRPAISANLPEEEPFSKKIRKYPQRDKPSFSREIQDEDPEEIVFDDEFVHINKAERIPEKKKEKIPIITCKREVFNFYKGDILPKHKAIPLASRSWHNRKSSGDYFTINAFQTYDDSVYENIGPELSFDQMGLNNTLVENLENEGIFKPVEIQKLAMPMIMSQKNVILTAETGCGKTLAFLIPVIEQIISWKQITKRKANTPLAVILTPSRELAQQIGKIAKKLCKNLDIQTNVITGGNTKSMVMNPPVNFVDLLVCTIGIINKLAGLKIYKMDYVRHVVLDEADTLVEDSFREVLQSFLLKINFDKRNTEDGYPDAAQITLNSATMPQELPVTLNKIVDVNTLNEVSTKNQNRILIPQKFLRLIPSLKPMTLLKFVKSSSKKANPLIIFSNNSATCDFINIFLEKFNVKSVNLNGKMPVEFRKKQFAKFQRGEFNILSATDAGCRGLDTVHVRDVINYDFPLMTAEYIHRCGRIGRIGSPENCKVINFISQPLEVILAKQIEFATRKMKPIPILDYVHMEKKIGDDFTGDIPNNNRLRSFDSDEYKNKEEDMFDEDGHLFNMPT